MHELLIPHAILLELSAPMPKETSHRMMHELMLIFVVSLSMDGFN